MAKSSSLEPNESSKRWKTKNVMVSWPSRSSSGKFNLSRTPWLGYQFLVLLYRERFVVLNQTSGNATRRYGLVVLNNKPSLSKLSIVLSTKCTPRARAKEALKITTSESGRSICWFARKHYGLVWRNVCCAGSERNTFWGTGETAIAQQDWICGNHHVWWENTVLGESWESC